jgi:type IV fimbrial biogenesis protein FimT
MTMRSRNQGFTLVELMVTLAVAIILLAVGMPLFSGIVGSNRATTQANELVSALKLARSEAVKRGAEVIVCSSDAGACGGAGDWRNGWFVHSDANEDGSLDPEEVLRTWEALSASSTLDVTGGASVAFQSTGDASGAFTFELDNADATGSDKDAAKRCITVTLSGQVRAVRGACP